MARSTRCPEKRRTELSNSFLNKEKTGLIDFRPAFLFIIDSEMEMVMIDESFFGLSRHFLCV